MKSIATLPCPFCGGNDLDDRGDNAIGCKNLACEAYIDIGHSVGAEARAHVAARWNRRAAARPDREGWQPIETAPKDGTSCIVYDGTVHVAEFVEGLGHWLSVGGDRGASWPSKWQPCPNPPSDHEQ